MFTRKEVINTLATVALLDAEMLEDSDDDELEEIIDNLEQDILLIVSTRYLHKPSPVAKALSWLQDVLPSLDDKRFKVMLRVNRIQFSFMLELIENNPIFHTTKNQFPVSVQLAIVLYRLGSYGSGCSYSKLATLFGIGDGGTIDRITNRIFKVIKQLQPIYITWPSATERSQIVDSMGEKLPHCIGFLDGSDFNLAESPSIDHQSYYSRKQRYSIKAQVVCDYSLRIRHIHVGYPGSVHDARILRNSDIGLNPQNYFSGEQWLAADSAYKLCKTILTPFRKNSTFRTLQERNRFNKYFSSFRVKIEQCFGILKQKFSSLKEIRTRIKNKKSHKFACQWILVCATIHNILLPMYDEEDLLYENEDDQDDQDEDDTHDDNIGINKRTALFTLLQNLI